MNAIGMRVTAYTHAGLTEVNFGGVVVAVSKDADSDPSFVILKDDNTFGCAPVWHCKKEN